MLKSSKIIYKEDHEIEAIRQSCPVGWSKVLAHVAKTIRPGISGLEIDRQAEDLIRSHGAVPGFKGYGGFPNTLCISVNEQVVHGIPSNMEFQNGDIVSVDCGVILNEYYGDSAYTFALGEVEERTLDLLRVTKTSLYKAVEAAKVGNRMGDIGYAVQSYAEGSFGYGVVRELVGHGIGKSLHEGTRCAQFW